MTGSMISDRRAIVCGITADHAFVLGSLIAGFRRHNADFTGDFVLFHDGLDAQDQARLQRLWPRMVFHLFDQSTVAARFAGLGLKAELGAVIRRYSPMIFAKFEMLDLLDTYDKCLWLDVDMLVQGSLEAVWAFEGLAWRPLPDGAFGRRAEVMETFADMRVDASVTLLNGGVVGMGQALRGVICADDIYAVAGQLIAQTDAMSVDELALYFLAASRGLPLYNLDLRFNHPVVAPGGRAAAIVHAIGPDKFWNAAPLVLAYPDWAQNLGEWQALGGAGYDGPLRLAAVQAATPDLALRAARNRTYWQAVYEDLRAGLPLRYQVDLRSDGNALRFFITGQPEAAHLRLTRQPNERRIGVELQFEDDSRIAPALFAGLNGLRIGAAKGKPLTLRKTKQGRAYGIVVPLAVCADVMGQLAEGLADL